MRESQAKLDALPDRIPRVLVFGDSMALLMGAGAGNWGVQNEAMAVSGFVAEIGCPLGRGGMIRRDGDKWEPDVDRCDWSQSWPELIDKQDPKAKVAVILTGAWDTADRKIPGDDKWRGFGDRKYDDFMRDEMSEATELLQDNGIKVVWLTSPPLDFGRGQEPRPPLDPPDIADRVIRMNEIIGEVVATHPGAALVDYGGYFANLPAGEDARLRPDGVHLEMSTADEVGQWLGPRIAEAAALPVPAPDPDAGDASVSGS
jgi:lysophospholipase L1-like esterase